MKHPQPGTNYFFVDESGDPTFYDGQGNLIVGRPGCSPIFILGFVETQDPEAVRQSLQSLQNEVITDPYFEGVPSLAKTAVAFHAKDDLPEIRYRVYKRLNNLDFRAQFVVARKIERVFRDNFGARATDFYDHLVTLLFENVLHRYESNRVYFAKRGSRDRQAPLSLAIELGIQRFEQKWGHPVTTAVDVQAQTPKGEPCLSVVDYALWAVYRAFTRGEMRYYRAIEEKVSLLVDLYDVQKYPRNWYNRRNPFHIKKITPL
jgi:hypothetical protein